MASKIENDVSASVLIKEPMCYYCLHFFGSWLCKAFPDGIPQDIRDGENEHRFPYPGDKGIIFESRMKEHEDE